MNTDGLQLTFGGFIDQPSRNWVSQECLARIQTHYTFYGFYLSRYGKIPCQNLAHFGHYSLLHARNANRVWADGHAHVVLGNSIRRSSFPQSKSDIARR
jgi:prepilin-type processing-associated H-X9-DG protein